MVNHTDFIEVDFLAMGFVPREGYKVYFFVGNKSIAIRRPTPESFLETSRLQILMKDFHANHSLVVAHDNVVQLVRKKLSAIQGMHWPSWKYIGRMPRLAASCRMLGAHQGKGLSHACWYGGN